MELLWSLHWAHTTIQGQIWHLAISEKIKVRLECLMWNHQNVINVWLKRMHLCISHHIAVGKIADVTLTRNHYLLLQLVIQTFLHTGGEISFLLHQQCLFYEDLLKLTPKNTHSQWEQANPKHFCFIVFMSFLADISKTQLCNICVKWLQLFLASALDPPVFNDAGQSCFSSRHGQVICSLSKTNWVELYIM